MSLLLEGHERFTWPKRANRPIHVQIATQSYIIHLGGDGLCGVDHVLVAVSSESVQAAVRALLHSVIFQHLWEFALPSAFSSNFYFTSTVHFRRALRAQHAWFAFYFGCQHPWNEAMLTMMVPA